MSKVRIYEVGPRDGLQNESRLISTEAKVEFINRLSLAGFTHIEATSFVSPKWVPQMADANDVMAKIDRLSGITYAALTPNLRGYERAVDAQATEVAVFASASEGFSLKNINCSIAESIQRFKPVMQAAKQDKITVRGYVSCVTDCPYDGPVDAASVADVALQLLELGCYEVSLGDTIGKATPQSIASMLDAVTKRVSPAYLAGHYHDTNQRALDNVTVSLSAGLRTFDSATAGLGGCPYAPGAKGNVATLPLHKHLQKLGYDSGLNVEQLLQAEQFITAQLAQA